jgi:hypothetical protein
MGRKRQSTQQIVNKLRQAKVLIEQWRRHYNTIRPHLSLGYRPPVPETVAMLPTGSGCLAIRSAAEDGQAAGAEARNSLVESGVSSVGKSVESVHRWRGIHEPRFSESQRR